jgi:hypothetical protein
MGISTCVLGYLDCPEPSRNNFPRFFSHHSLACGNAVDFPSSGYSGVKYQHQNQRPLGLLPSKLETPIPRTHTPPDLLLGIAGYVPL